MPGTRILLFGLGKLKVGPPKPKELGMRRPAESALMERDSSRWREGARPSTIWIRPWIPPPAVITVPDSIALAAIPFGLHKREQRQLAATVSSQHDKLHAP